MSFRSDYGGQIKKINTQLTNSVHFGEPQASPVEIVNYSIPDRVTTLENYIVDVKKHGAKGDGVTDDTAAIQYCLDTYGVAYLSAGTYMVSGIVVDTQQKLYGAGQEQSILKALPTCTTAVVTCRNAAYAIVRDFSIYGGDNLGAAVSCDGLTVESTKAYDDAQRFELTPNYQLQISHLTIWYIGKTGMRLKSTFNLGETAYDGSALGPNYIYHVGDMFIDSCNEYCLWNAATDVCFSNLAISGGKKAGIYTNGANCNWSNIKIDWSGNDDGWTTATDEKWKTSAPSANMDALSYAGLIINGQRNHFSSIDVQQNFHVGVKILQYAKDTVFNGSIDTNGTNSSRAGSISGNAGLGLYCHSCNNTLLNVVFSDFHSDPLQAWQTQDIFVNYSRNTIINSPAIDRAKVYITANAVNANVMSADGVHATFVMAQADYDALATKDARTLYLTY